MDIKGDGCYVADSEDLENIRRMVERGMEYAHTYHDSVLVDIFQHILDNYNKIKKDIE